MNDIYQLCTRLIRKFNQEFGRNVSDISEDAVRVLKSYHWPGNVRELENVIGRAMINMKMGERIIGYEHLPILNNNVKWMDGVEQDALGNGEIMPLKDYLDQAEKRYLIKTLKAKNGNKTETAKELGISIRNLYYKLEKYQVR